MDNVHQLTLNENVQSINSLHFNDKRARQLQKFFIENTRKNQLIKKLVTQQINKMF